MEQRIHSVGTIPAHVVAASIVDKHTTWRYTEAQGSQIDERGDIVWVVACSCGTVLCGDDESWAYPDFKHLVHVAEVALTFGATAMRAS